MKKTLFCLALFCFCPFIAKAEEGFLQKTQEQFSTWVNHTWNFLENAQIETIAPFLKNLPAGTVAIVNGTEISFRQLEGLEDMELAARGESNAVILEDISKKYAIYLTDLIEQILVRQELEKRDMLISPEKVTEIEKIIQASYGTETFEEILINDSINPDFWREQTLSRLEKELWQEYLSLQVKISEAEIKDYLVAHVEDLSKPEKYTLVLVSSAVEEDIKAAHEAKIATTNSDKNVFVQERTLALEALPDMWQEDLKKMELGSFSSIRQLDNIYSYLVFKAKSSAHTLTNLEAYTLAEHVLRDEKTAELYIQWLDTALQNADLQMASQLIEVIQNNKVQE